MDPVSKIFTPPVLVTEEWDNPAMAEFKRQEAEERVAFAKSHTREEWLAAMKDSRKPDVTIQLAPQTRGRFPFKLIRLPW